jgi:hypothetical protein
MNLTFMDGLMCGFTRRDWLLVFEAWNIPSFSASTFETTFRARRYGRKERPVPDANGCVCLRQRALRGGYVRASLQELRWHPNWNRGSRPEQGLNWNAEIGSGFAD